MSQAAVLCGGQGTRLLQHSSDKTPKTLRKVAGRPFIEHKLWSLSRAGITEVVLLCGPHLDVHLNTVHECRTFGLSIEYWADDSLGTGGAVAQALPALSPAFWLTFGDSLTLLPPLPEPDDVLGSSVADLTVVSHPWPNVRVEGTTVALYADEPILSGTHLDYGMTACRADLFRGITESCTLQRALGPAVRAGGVRATPVRAPLYHLNTARDLYETESYLETLR